MYLKIKVSLFSRVTSQRKLDYNLGFSPRLYQIQLKQGLFKHFIMTDHCLSITCLHTELNCVFYVKKKNPTYFKGFPFINCRILNL